jgi:hypothetical protein
LLRAGLELQSERTPVNIADGMAKWTLLASWKNSVFLASRQERKGVDFLTELAGERYGISSLVDNLIGV